MDAGQVVLPPNLPAVCFTAAAQDYSVPHMVLVALVSKESGGKSVVRANKNGSYDYGVAQQNSDSWARVLQRDFGITPNMLMNPCQGIRAAAYVLRMEWYSPSCKDRDVWCAVGRYHAPNSPQRSVAYAMDVKRLMAEIVSKGKF